MVLGGLGLVQGFTEGQYGCDPVFGQGESDWITDSICSDGLAGRTTVVWVLLIAAGIAIVVGLLRLNNAPSPVVVAEPIPAKSDEQTESDLTQQLARLGELRANGTLSEEQFEAAKRKLLD